MAVENYNEMETSVADQTINGGPTYAERAELASAIAHPMAPYKSYKKVSKCLSKAFKRNKVIRGIKPINKVLRSDNFKGFCVLSGNAEPIDIISHIPVACEGRHIPYCFVPTSADCRGVALMIPEDESYQKAYDAALGVIKALPAYISA